MAQAEHLPIYKASYDLCLYIEQVVRGSSRYHKYALGADRSPAVELLGVQPSAEADAGCFENLREDRPESVALAWARWRP